MNAPAKTLGRWVGHLGLGVFLASLCVLTFEITLTRIFSVLFRAPYVFLVVSVAICGLGLGGMAAAYLGPLDTPRAELRRLAKIALLQAVTLSLPTPLLFCTPLSSWLGGGWETLGVIFLPLCAFLAAGAFLSLVFRAYGEWSGALYFLDLLGAALASLLVIGLLQRYGGISTTFLIAAIAACNAVQLFLGSMGRPQHSPTGADATIRPLCWLGVALLLGATLAIFGCLNATWKWVDLPPIKRAIPGVSKPLFVELADPQIGARIVHTEWNAFVRTDVVENAGVDTKYIYTDGDVPTQMEPFHGDFSEVAYLRRFIGFFPYYLFPEPPRRVLCIGPGGGLDLLLALMGRAREIEAVEINPSIFRLVQRYRQFYGDLYRCRNVRVYVDEGRSFVRRSSRAYDLIYLALAKTATTETMGVALVDNYLYTVEAFRDYLAHLTERGLLAIVLQEAVLLDRAFLTAAVALSQLGVPRIEVPDHLIALSVSPQTMPYGPYRRLLLVSHRPWEETQAAALCQLAISLQMVPFFVPKVFEPPPYVYLRTPALSTAELCLAFGQYHRLAGGGPANLTPVTDNRPFFVDLARGLHPHVGLLLGVALLFTLLFAGITLVAWQRRESSGDLRTIGGWLGYFGALGIGFMLIEVALIQKLSLFLGYPTLTLSVVLFGLLLSSSLGSAWTQRWPTVPGRKLLEVVVGLMVVLLVLFLFLDWGLNRWLSQPILVRSLLSMILVGLPGFCLGMPFPLGLRMLKTTHAHAVPFVWGVNGVTSVLGSVLAMAAAKYVGYSVLLLGAGVVYGSAVLICETRGLFR